ncbi:MULTISPECIES: SMP-30/gluconolactonase/LRE family protein [Micromonospora]|uniref:SMP-30/gluconolactonase/LRE family protein n=1 Tax=Micromonospora solifontis TaxID=2487138 RepID=A0ABX9WD33_9ACTN|nr:MULTISPECIES: SMP-30/gluconolactonase/LRE family protein [Micromonospora]NES16177.1 SMP-30/gluconolactonase/LRE family protein [Micromonospora sp. PPF5-17B]NES38022.1 SMP-30/gluconolactonase/LRE family protein [Micromonospora solifontis]NES57664.1 SMP-30/gluconolactonase/LRE family protein [Micromonospora sp. PPF5-6]RNL97701.1 SMP-30/gluconolactonase/LRE family protein [Micromonospora solifontis]
MSEPRILLDGLAFGESPRWHDGRLWLADWGAGEVLAVDDAGRTEVAARVDGLPTCLDWLPDGRLLVVAGRAGRLLRQEPDGTLDPYADLAGLVPHPWNEVVTDARGNAYVNTIGFDFPGGEYAPGAIALVKPDGAARIVADDVAFPNGMALTPDGRTLIVAESYASRLTGYDVAADGSLTGRRVWATVPDSAPDGICLDADGAVWYGDVPNRCAVRVAEGGRVLDRIDLDRGCFACALGGPDTRTLFLVATEWSLAALAGGPRTGRVLTVPAPAPAAG